MLRPNKLYLVFNRVLRIERINGRWRWDQVLGYRTTRLKNRAQVGSITGPLLYSFVDLKLKEKYSSPYTWGSLKMVLSLCPSLLKVHITTIAGLRNADLLSLISVERLCELINKGCEDSIEVTFDDGVTPLLEAKGRNLKVLKLQDLDIPININTICELCPNLDVLAVTGNRNFNPSRPKRIKLDIPKLKNLVKLSLGSYCDSFRGPNPNSCIPSENLAFLLLSPLLVKIDIRNCDTLTDDVLLTAVQSNPFLHLEELVLRGCDSITNRSVNVFMQENGIEIEGLDPPRLQ
jgi:hypothetical protein